MMKHKNELYSALIAVVLLAALILVCTFLVGMRAGAADTRPPVTTPEPLPDDPLVCVIRFDPELPIEDDPKPTPETIPTPEPTTDPLADYTDEDIMCLTNMVYSEISCITYDASYTKEEQDQAMQEWTCVALNHIKIGLADTIPDLMRTKTAAGYYIWHKIFSTSDYMDDAVAANPELYERCRTNVLIALSGCMQVPLPDGVIYADLKTHGPVYKTYSINTGYYRSTVYLCYG